MGDSYKTIIYKEERKMYIFFLMLTLSIIITILEYFIIILNFLFVCLCGNSSQMIELKGLQFSGWF